VSGYRQPILRADLAAARELPAETVKHFALGNELIDHLTVVTYDRRGLSRSKINTPNEKLTLSTHSDDAHSLLAALTNEAAFVSAAASVR
jgi:hypothetical protein